MIFEIVHGRTFFSFARYLFSLFFCFIVLIGFMYCVQYMKPCVQYFSIIFFFLHLISSAMYEKIVISRYEHRKYKRLRRVSLLMFLCRVRPEMSYQLLKRYFWPNSFKVCFIFFVP